MNIQLLTVITFIYGNINCLFDMYQIWQRHPHVDDFINSISGKADRWYLR